MAVTYLRPGVKIDPYSGEPDGEDWESATEHPAGAAFVTSLVSSSTSDGTDEDTTVGWQLRVPEGSPSPGPADRIRFDGHVFAQDGTAIRPVNPFTGWAPYARVMLREVT